SGGNSRQVGSRKGIKDVHGIPLLGTMSPLSYFPTLLLSYRLKSYHFFYNNISLISTSPFVTPPERLPFF
ncbi:MAG: hypothetical protein AB1414_12980, partial [bacterium]